MDEPERGLILRFTIWFTSTWLGQRIYVRAIPPIDRALMLWSRGRWSLSPPGDPDGLGGLALLTTIGARTGKRRHTPLGFARDGNSLVILASNAARSYNPTWYFNLKKNALVEITVRGGGYGRYRAREIPPGPERERLWKIACAMNPGFDRYPSRTGGRLIPVIHCTPAEQEARSSLTPRTLVSCCALLACLVGTARAAPPFLPGGDPAVDPDDFRVTAFASGLDFPMGMVQLADDSLLVGTSRWDGTPGGGIFDSIGRLVRYSDGDGDGVADGPGAVLFDGLPGLVTSVRREGDLVFAASAQILFARISILRTGTTPGSPLALLGAIDLSFPAPWDHFTLSLASRTTTGSDVELVFPVGSQFTQSVTAPSVTASGLLSASLPADTLYRMVIDDSGAIPSVASHGAIASGLRNAFGAVFEPDGDLLFVDNGFEDPDQPSEPLMTDELNALAAAEQGGPIEDYGFPSRYVEYATGNAIGTAGRLPTVAFRPIAAGESRGPAALALAPIGFPAALRNGAFVGFHGQFGAVGAANPYRPVVWVDPSAGRYFHFVSALEPAIGHPDGLLATSDSLFIADFSSVSGFQGFGSGSIYQIRALAPTCAADDSDCDGIADAADTCPHWASAQTDTDVDGRGDACECTDQDGNGRNTVSDLIAINTAIFDPAQATPLCDGNGDGLCNVQDIIAANIEIYSPTNTSTCARQPVPGP